MIDEPLVTVSIITYNSAQTVIETLDSIFSQSYHNIELIISDDCSSDNTVAICQQWVAEHSLRFAKCRIIEAKKNTGITANCNRAIVDAKGFFLKLLAGDDLLEPEAISEYVTYMSENPQAMYVFSRVTVFGHNQKAIDWYNNTIFDYSFFSLNREEQYKWLIGKWFQPIPAASAFINAKLAKDSNVLYYDERIPMLEDWPKWIALSQKGIDFHFIDKPLARYRVTDSSVCSGENNKGIIKESLALLFRYYQFKPTIRLFGFRRAFVQYIRASAVLNKGFIWKYLNSLINRAIAHD